VLEMKNGFGWDGLPTDSVTDSRTEADVWRDNEKTVSGCNVCAGLKPLAQCMEALRANG
jgi:hypothetical protein